MYPDFFMAAPGGETGLAVDSPGLIKSRSIYYVIDKKL